MIPIRDDCSGSRLPIISLSVMALSVAVFALELHWSANGQLGEVWQSWGFVGARFWGSLGEVLQDGNLAAAVAWLLFSLPSLWTSLFLHASFSQLLGNLLFLWVFAPRVEAFWGRGCFLAFYLGCGGLTYGIQAIFVDPSVSTPLVGSNGAIAAILGAYLILFPTAKIDSLCLWGMGWIPVQLPAGFYGIWWFVQQVFYGIGRLSAEVTVNSWSVGYWAHGLGLLVGGGLALWAKHQLSMASSED
ncbi:MAG: rhomboid family intramembrane serine protease [Geitlerinemataceae cyanobacterium]